MYEEQGVDQFSSLAIPIAPASIRVVASPWNVSFTNPELGVAGSVGAAVHEVVVGNDTIYLTALQYPLQVIVSVSGSARGTVNVSQPFSAHTLDVSSAKVLVKTDADGQPVSGVSVDLSEGGVSVANGSSVGGVATFYVLPGNYSIAGAYGNYTSTGAVAAQGGVQSSVSLAFSVPAQSTTSSILTDVLAGTAVLGVAISAVVWVRAYRKR
jgi:hypothetical protein